MSAQRFRTGGPGARVAVTLPPQVIAPSHLVPRARAGLTVHGLAALMLLGGCGGHNAAGEQVDNGVAACRQHHPTISEGVYGCITQSNDAGDLWVKPFPKFSIHIFVERPPPTPDDGLVPLAHTESDAGG